MAKVQLENDLLLQSQFPPIEDLALVESHVEIAIDHVTWDDVGILFDQGEANQLVLLLNKNTPVSVLRLCLPVQESLAAIKIIQRDTGRLLLGYYQASKLEKSQITSLKALTDIWESIEDQTSEISEKALCEFFSRQYDESKKNGRGKDFSVETKRKVREYSHGRCMFEGCGLNLKLDELSGYEGNFGYLAHNVASSEHGARGGKGISEALSDDPKNILLLCDKHHRLIDKVAAADFQATRLSKIRQEFGLIANRLLDGLSYEPLPAYAVLWPVGGDVVASPSEFQVSTALSVIKARPDGPINTLTDNNELLVAMEKNKGWDLLPSMINSIANNILQQTHNKQHRAALFAFGLMPALVGLGAELGNKVQITPMLRFRDSGTWTWPLEKPKDDVINIEIDDSLKQGDKEVVLSLSLTARPIQFEEFIAKKHLKEVNITPFDESYGNGCIGHPDEGAVLMDVVHKLLHQLVSEYSVKKVHLLPCASNAACVSVGKAIDNYHPDIIVYDFEGDTMVPRLTIRPNIDGNQLLPAVVTE